MTAVSKVDRRLKSTGEVKWLPCPDLRIDRTFQRDQSRRWVLDRVGSFDVDKLGLIVVSDRGSDGLFVIDGQHRVELIRAVGWGDQLLECEVFSGLSRQQEAQLFLDRNDRRSIGSFDAFRSRIVAGDEVAADIDRIVRSCGLTVSKDREDAAVAAVAALERVYACHGPRDFGRMLRVLRDGFGAHRQSFSSENVQGVGMVVGLFNGDLDDASLIAKLSGLAGGPVGLRQEANRRRAAFGRSWAESVAIAVVDLYNAGRARASKLPDWLKAVAAAEETQS